MSGPTSLSADVWVQEGDAVKVGDLEFTVLETPGHTAGSVCYLIGNNIFSGDTLFQGSCGRTDLPTGNWGCLLYTSHLFSHAHDQRTGKGSIKPHAAKNSHQQEKADFPMIFF